MKWLIGKKTYLIAFAAAIYGAGVQTGLWPHYAFVDYLLAGGAAAALRSGVNNAVTTAVQPPKE